jgi:hypothetical protein
MSRHVLLYREKSATVKTMVAEAKKAATLSITRTMTHSMRRRHLIELHDLPQCPRILRDGLTDFLQVTVQRLDVYSAVRPILLDAIARSGAQQVFDMCSGAGGPWPAWQRDLGVDVDVTLTDKFPNNAARALVGTESRPDLRYLERSVDATDVQSAFAGFRTIFTAFHHFRPEQARQIIRDAVAKRQPIGIFEFTYRHPAALLFMLLSPFAVWGLTPTMRNRSWSKLFLTYVIPVIPLLVTFDGVVSCWRTYTVDELKAMAGSSGYRWLAGTRKTGKWPLPVTYFIGYPARDSHDGGARPAR